MKRLVATTSTSCLDYYQHDYDIRTIRIKIDMGDHNFKDDGTEITADEFYQALEANKNLVPKTSQPSLGELIEFFEGLADEGYEEVIVTTISSKLSGTFNGISQVAEMLEDRIKIIPFDTKTVCFNEGYFALTAAKMIQEEKSTDEILSRLTYLQSHVTILFAVDSLEFLVKNGRLSGAAGLLGKYLKIKPLLQVEPDGSIQAIEKIRTTKKALERVGEYLQEYTKGHEYEAYIAYTGGELKEYFKDVLKESFGIENLAERPCSPVVGCHVGPGAIGLGIFLKD
jgi:DegV family protein with EDD domain